MTHKKKGQKSSKSASAQKSKSKKVVSEAQLRAIRYSYYKKNNSLVTVDIKTHDDANGGHFHIIMDDIDDKYVSVGLSTHSKKGKNGGTNYSMEKSPFDDGRQSYMRRQGIIDKKKRYSNPRKGTITINDYNVAKKYSDRALNKYLENKKK